MYFLMFNILNGVHICDNSDLNDVWPFHNEKEKGRPRLHVIQSHEDV